MVNFEHVITSWVVDMIHFSDLLYFDEDNPLKKVRYITVRDLSVIFADNYISNSNIVVDEYLYF